MIYAFIRLWATIFLRLYFRKTIVYGHENVPSDGPLILASNHPSAFLEASVLATVMKRPVHFLVRGDMFNPKFQFVFNWTKQIPIYRQKDGISNLRKNASSFDLTYKKLAEGESVLIFPEAKTTLEKKMRPIQRGTAHLAFGTLPHMKSGDSLFVQPVGVNFTEPRLPGTDVVIKFGRPFITENGTRDDRDAIERFTEQLSQSMDPLIIQVKDDQEKNYDVLASIYFRMMYDDMKRDAHADLQKIAAAVNDSTTNSGLLQQSNEILKTLHKHKSREAAYFPDLIMLNKVGLAMLALLKAAWWIAGGWLWRLVRKIIFSKIRTPTFQSPTTVGVFMVVMPLVSIILSIIFLLTGLPAYWVLIWLFIMWMGTFIRMPLHLIVKMLTLNRNVKSKLKISILALKNEIQKIT